MPFPVLCRSCRTKIRVPRRMAGKRFRCVMCGKVNIVPGKEEIATRATRLKITCPKCQTMYRIAVRTAKVGSRGQPVVLKMYCSICDTRIEAASSRKASSAVDLAPTWPTLPDQIPISAPIEAVPPCPPLPAPVPLMSPAKPSTVSPTTSSGLGWPAVAALVLGGVSLPLAFVPEVRLLSLVGGVATLVLAAWAIVDALAHFRGVGFPFVGFATGVAALVCASFYSPPDDWKPVDGIAWIRHPIVAGAGHRKVTEGEWKDASHCALVAGNARVHILNASFRWDTPKGKAKRQPTALLVRVSVENFVRKTQLQYTGWGRAAGPDTRKARLTDDAGKEYPLIAEIDPRDEAHRCSSVTLEEAQAVEDLLVFRPPPLSARYFRLELQAENVEQTGVFRFQLDREMINGLERTEP